MSRNFGLRLRPSTPTPDSLNPYALFEPSVAKMGGVTVRDVDVSVLRLLDCWACRPTGLRCAAYCGWCSRSFLEALPGILACTGGIWCCCVGRIGGFGCEVEMVSSRGLGLRNVLCLIEMTDLCPLEDLHGLNRRSMNWENLPRDRRWNASGNEPTHLQICALIRPSTSRITR